MRAAARSRGARSCTTGRRPSGCRRSAGSGCTRWTARRASGSGSRRGMPARLGRRPATTCSSATRPCPGSIARSAWPRTARASRHGSLNGTVVDGVHIGGVPAQRQPAPAGRVQAALRVRRRRQPAAGLRAHAFGELDGTSVAMRVSFALLERAAAQRRDRAARGRDRHRQGAGGGGDPPGQRAREQAVRGGRLRRDPGQPARERAVRPREGRLHRRRRAGAPARSRRPTAAPVPRRDRRAAARAAAEAAARARDARGAPRWAPARTGRSTCASSPRPTATCAAR